jgi:hypothetical protein
MALSFCSCSRAVGGRRALRLSKVPAAICRVSRCYLAAWPSSWALDDGKNRELYLRILAARCGRPADDLQLRLAAAALSAALSEANRYWAEQDGAPPLTATARTMQA